MTQGISPKNFGGMLQKQFLRDRLRIRQPATNKFAVALPQAISAGFTFALNNLGLGPMILDADGLTRPPIPAQLVGTMWTALNSSATNTYTETTVTDSAAWDLTNVNVGDIITTADGKFGKITAVNDAGEAVTVQGWYTIATGLKATVPANNTIATVYKEAATGVLGSVSGGIAVDGVLHTGISIVDSMTKSQTTSPYMRQTSGRIYQGIRSISILSGTNIGVATHMSIGYRVPTSLDGTQGQFWRIPLPEGFPIRSGDIEGVMMVDRGGGTYYTDIQDGAIIRPNSTIGIGQVTGAGVSMSLAEDQRIIAFVCNCSAQPTSAVEFMFLTKDHLFLRGM